MSTSSATSSNFSSTPILSVTFAPPTTATNGWAGSERIDVRVVDLALQQESRRAAVEQQRGGVRGRVGAVRGAERVVDVGVGQRAIALRERCVVLRLARIEPDVLEQDDVVAGHLVERGREADGLPEQLGGLARDRPQRQRGSTPLGLPRWLASTSRAP